MLHNSGAILSAGTTYTTSRFTPAFSFVGQACWSFGGDDAALATIADTGSGSFWILRPSAVVDANGTARTVPSDLVGWIRANTGLSIGKPTSLSVGGFSATLLPGTVRSTASLNGGGDFNFACDTTPAECVAASNQGFNGLGFPPNQPFDLVVVSVRGQTLLIGVTANAADWAAAQPRLVALVTSLKFPA